MNARIMSLTTVSLFIVTILYCASYPKETRPVQKGHLTASKGEKEIFKSRTIRMEVFQLFGPPDFTTMDGDGNEVWNYNKMPYAMTEGDDGGSLIFWRSSRSMRNSPEKSYNLIIVFDRKSIIQDYRVIKEGI